MKTRRVPPREKTYIDLKAEQAEFGLRLEYASIGLAEWPTEKETGRSCAVEILIEQHEFDRRIERGLGR